MVSVSAIGTAFSSRHGTSTTISDVARSAGVSTTTVSRYLRGDRVRAARAIQEAIGRLDYRPSAAARSLKSGVTGAIGVVVPDVTNPFFAAVVKGIESVARQGAHTILLSNTEESVDREARVLDRLTGRVDGIIMAPANEQDPLPLRPRAQRVPIVFIDRELDEHDAFDTVLVDNVGGARAATEHLLALGHERIALIGGPLDTTPGRERHEGFALAMAGAGIEPAAPHVQISDFRRSGGYQATLRLFGLEEPPTAILSLNNLMTVGALHALHDMDVRLRRDVSLIGFDDLEFAALLDPPLTVVDRPAEEQGVLAMRLLLNRLSEDARPAPPRRIVMETRLVERGSCGPPPGGPGTAGGGRAANRS